MDANEILKIKYDFRFEDGREARFRVLLDARTLEPVKPVAEDLPEWVRLDFNQCTGCPLSLQDHSNCPLAARLYPIVDSMRRVVSTERVKVAVLSSERAVVRKTTAQEGLSSLMGVTIATSGCPRTAFFKPMARFHLPFADLDETIYRATSTYMVAQYFRAKKGLSTDLRMRGLQQLYKQIAEVNRRMADRLRATRREDGSVNAIVILDMFAQGLPLHFNTLLGDLEPLFEAYMDESLAMAD